MDRPLTRSMASAAVAAICLIGGATTWFERLTAPLMAQQAGARMPGPIIVDAAGPGTDHSYVPAPSSVSSPMLSTFVVTYSGFTPQAQAAFQAAVDVWAAQVQSSVPIRVSATWSTELPANVLGSGGAKMLFRDFAGAALPNTWFPAALANKMAGVDLDPADIDIVATFNANLPWYYGTDGNTGANYDLMSVVLKELGHGLGFFGSMNVAGGVGSWGIGVPPPYPTMYDRFAYNGASRQLIDTSFFTNPSVALGVQLVSNNIFFAGFNAATANAGTSVRLHAPNPWQSGSSFSHFDEATFPAGNPNSLMTPLIGVGEAIHDPGPVARGVFADIGWGPVASCWYLLSQSSLATGSAARTVSVNVVAGAGCSWVATSNAPFITINSGSGSGTGNGTVGFSVAANPGAPRNGTLTIAGVTFTVSQNTRTTITGDFDNDRRAEVTVFRPSSGTWYSRNAATGATAALVWGGAGDIPVVGDYDGDGSSDVAVFRPSNGAWYLRASSTGGFTAIVWGTVGDVPVPGDYEGDGKTDVVVFRPSNGTWYARSSSTGALTTLVWGGPGDVPVPGDYDGDGETDVAVFRPSDATWYVRSSRTGFLTAVLWGGGPGDVAVPGDYDGDGKTDVAIFRATTATWYIRNSGTGLTESVVAGAPGDVPVPADYDGDGRTDLAVFRAAIGTWYIRNSSNGSTTTVVWGGENDFPILQRP